MYNAKKMEPIGSGYHAVADDMELLALRTGSGFIRWMVVNVKSSRVIYAGRARTLLRAQLEAASAANVEGLQWSAIEPAS
jgi:hypothetical protein